MSLTRRRGPQSANVGQGSARSSDVAPRGTGANTAPVQVPYRLGRGFSLPSRLMDMARRACDLACAAGHGRGRVRAWVPACKTGGLAYTITMLLLDARAESPIDVMVFATDADERALGVARAGRYPAGAALGMHPGLRARYTLDEGDTIRMAEGLREKCVFSRHHVQRDAPFPRLDLIVCHRIFDGVPSAKRSEVTERLRGGLRPGGLILALDHPELFPREAFEAVADGCFRPLPRRRPASRYLPPEGLSLSDFTAAQAERLEIARAALVPWSRKASPPPSVSDALRGLGQALIVCDAELRVVFTTIEAQRLFDASIAADSLDLVRLVQHMPGGLDLVSAARRVLAAGGGQDVILRKGSRSYLACARLAANDRGLSIAFTDISAFEAASASAARQQERHAALAELRKLASSPGDASSLYAEAFRILSLSLRGSAAAIVFERSGDRLEVKASRGLGSEPLLALRGFPAARRSVEEALAQGALVSLAVTPGRGASLPEAARVARAARAPETGAPSGPSSLGIEQAIACPVVGDGEVIGVLACFGARGEDTWADEDFVRAVCGALGDGVARCREHRRMTLELAATSAARQASTLADLGAALLRALRPYDVEELEIGERTQAAPERWVAHYSGPARAPERGAESSRPLAPHAGSNLDLGADGHAELWLTIRRDAAADWLLRLRGKSLRSADAELARSLGLVVELLREFLERRSLPTRHEGSASLEPAQLELLYSSLPVVVSIHDAKGALIQINRELEPAEAAGTASPPVASAAGESEARERESRLLRRLYEREMPYWIERVLATGEGLTGVELLVPEGSGVTYWSCNFVPLRDRQGARAVGAIAQDISAFKRVELSLRDADRRKDDFIALLGHELRNPIAAIRNATELLARLDEPAPQLRRLLGIYERQTAHTAKLLDGLLDVARVARGKIRLKRAPLPIVELVRQAVDDRRGQFRGRRLELKLPEAEPWILADRVRMLQIVDNLLSNALKFTSDSGRIRVEVALFDEQGELVVEDDGAGIEPEFLPFIFEPFRQGPATPEGNGLGLGLALVHGLTELHGFRLEVESAGVGQGAAFRLSFPLVEAPDAPPPRSRAAPRALHLMLVEDNGDVSDTLADLLSADGHRVEVASSAETALEQLSSLRVDVALIDIGLPGMNGLQLAARLRQDPNLSSMKLVALTGFGDAATESRIRDAGFDHYLVKPVSFEALRYCLARLEPHAIE